MLSICGINLHYTQLIFFFFFFTRVCLQIDIIYQKDIKVVCWENFNKVSDQVLTKPI